MRLTHRVFPLLCLIALSLGGSVAFPQSSNPMAPLAVGSHRELFVDRYLIDTLTNVRLQLHEPRDEGVVIKLDNKWEGPHSGYSTVIHDGDLFRMYYRGISQPGPDGNENERTCYAESHDGIHWTKPDLGIFEFEEVQPTTSCCRRRHRLRTTSLRSSIRVRVCPPRSDTRLSAALGMNSSR